MIGFSLNREDYHIIHHSQLHLFTAIVVDSSPLVQDLYFYSPASFTWIQMLQKIAGSHLNKDILKTV